MHTISGRWQFGLFLSLVTAILWGVLPIALKGLLKYMDVNTITWFRFTFAAIFLGGYLLINKRLPSLLKLKTRHVLFLACITIFCLLVNYIIYMMGLALSSPESAQVMIQLAPMLLLLGGVFFFKETFNYKQKLGVIVFVIGLALFFNHRIDELFNFQNEFGFGIFLVFVAAIFWAAYALAQKQLLKHYASEEIMLLVYVVGAFMFLPISTPEITLQLDTAGWLLAIFCGANTLIAYGAFAEALEHWEASRVSATLAITPVFTLVSMQLVNIWIPGYIEIELLNNLSVIGAVVLVLGSGVTALSKTK